MSENGNQGGNVDGEYPASRLSLTPISTQGEEIERDSGSTPGFRSPDGFRTPADRGRQRRTIVRNLEEEFSKLETPGLSPISKYSDGQDQGERHKRIGDRLRKPISFSKKDELGRPIGRNKHVERQIRNLQSTTELLIPKLPFARAVKQLSDEVSNENRIELRKWKVDAIDALHQAAEMYLIDLMKNGDLLAKHGKRCTLRVQDVQLTRRVQGDRFGVRRRK